MSKKILYWLPAILYMALIFYLSGRPAPEAAKEIPIFFEIKLVHLFEYGILSLLIHFGLAKTTKQPLFSRFFWSILLTVLYGLTDEIHQLFVETRTASFFDLIADFLGASLAQAGLGLFKRGQNLHQTINL